MSEERSRRLTRSTDSKIAGVAGGLGEYFDIDPTLVRLAFVVTFLLGWGISLVAYIVLWIVMPAPGEAPEGGAAARPAGERPGEGTDPALVFGVLLLGIGLLLLANQVGWRWFGLGFFADIFWPVALLALGLFLILRARDRSRS